MAMDVSRAEADTEIFEGGARQLVWPLVASRGPPPAHSAEAKIHIGLVN